MRVPFARDCPDLVEVSTLRLGDMLAGSDRASTEGHKCWICVVWRLRGSELPATYCVQRGLEVR